MENKTEGNNPMPPVRSFQRDMEEAFKHTTSVSSIVSADQNRKEVSGEMAEEKKVNQRNNISIGVSILFLILGIIGIGVGYYAQIAKRANTLPPTKTLIGFFKEEPVRVKTKQDFIDLIVKDEKSTLPLNSVLFFNTEDTNGTPRTVRSIFDLITPNIPEPLARSFSDIYMLGLYSNGTNQPFIILKTRDFATSYAGMLAWEKTMLVDLGDMFDVSPTATTSAFIDTSVQSQDARKITDENNNTILTYSFVDKETLIITSNEDALEGLFGKYIISQSTR